MLIIQWIFTVKLQYAVLYIQEIGLGTQSKTGEKILLLQRKDHDNSEQQKKKKKKKKKKNFREKKRRKEIKINKVEKFHQQIKQNPYYLHNK